MPTNIKETAGQLAEQYYQASADLHDAIIRFGRDGDTEENRKNFLECKQKERDTLAHIENFLNSLTK